MAILYSLVARGKVVLAEFTSTSGNFPTVVRFMLSKIAVDVQDGKRMSIVYDKHVFHYMMDAYGLIYLCMAEEGDKRRLPFLFLEDVQRRFTATYSEEQCRAAIAFAMNEGFAPTLQATMGFYNSDPSADNLQQLRSKIDDTKSVMVENIDQVLARGEKIELLVDKTDRLSQQAVQFRRQSRKLQTSMWWRRVQRVALLTFIGAVLIFFLTAWGCGGLDFHKCSHHH